MLAADYKLLFRMTRRLNAIGFTELNQAGLAAEIGVTQATMSRSLARLCESGVLERHGRGGGSRAAAYRLNAAHVLRRCTNAVSQGERSETHNVNQTPDSPAEATAERLLTGQTSLEADNLKDIADKRPEYSPSSPQAFDILLRTGAERLARSNLNAIAFKLLLRLVPRLNAKQYVEVKQTALAAEAGVTQATVSRSLAALCAVGVLQRSSGKKRSQSYQMNPKFFVRDRSDVPLPRTQNTRN
jgi:DNA-binding MarR family transcriptional regulator